METDTVSYQTSVLCDDLLCFSTNLNTYLGLEPTCWNLDLKGKENNVKSFRLQLLWKETNVVYLSNTHTCFPKDVQCF